MINSTLKQTNSLINVGDSITIKTDSPIIPKNTLILGWYLTTNDIIDKENYISGEYAILPNSENLVESENNLNWKYLGKGIEGIELSNFCDDCNSQEEPYYVCFRFTKIKSSGQIINISKVSLKIQDNLENKDEYDTPIYDDSIFGEDDLYSECHVKWAFNVLNKLKTPGILPTFIKRDKDFSIFWGWLCHWFAIIVCYGRKFLNIFQYKDLFREFLRQKDIYIGERSNDIYTTVDIFTNDQELLYKFEDNKKLILDHIVDAEGWITTDFINVLGSNILKFQFYNLTELSDEEYKYNFQQYCDVDIYVSFLDYNKQYLSSFTINTKNKGTEYFCTVPTNENMKFLVFSYPKIYEGKINIPLYLRVFNFGQSYFSNLEDLTKYDLLNVFNDFRERGTNKIESFIKKVLNISIGDSFYSNYLNSKYIGWYLNQNSPVTISNFSNSIDINRYLINDVISLNTGTFVKFDDNFISLTDDNSIYVKWNRDDITKLFIFCSLYTEKKQYFDEYTILNKRNDLHGIVVTNIPKGVREITIPLRIVKSVQQIGVLYSTIQIDYKDLYLFVSEITVNGEIYDLKYLQIKAIYFIQNNLTTFIEDENDEEVDVKDKLTINKNQIILTRKIVSDQLKINFINSSANRMSVSTDKVILSKSISSDTFSILFSGGGDTYISSCNDTILGCHFNNNIYNNANYKITYTLDNFILNINLIVLSSITNEELGTYNFNYAILESDKENGYKEINLIEVDNSGNEINLGFLLFRLKKYSLKIEKFLTFRKPYDEISLFNKEAGIQTRESLVVNYNLYDLPYNLGFLNIFYWYLNFYKNNSKYSNKEVEEIISQKFLPYNCFKLYQKSDMVINKKVRPLSYTKFEIVNPTVCYVNEKDLFTGNIELSWKGGDASYSIKIEGKKSDGSIYKQVISNINTTNYVLRSIYTGTYTITLTDSLGNSLIRNNVLLSALKPLEVRWRIYLVPGKVEEVNDYDDVYINISGGSAPFKITYPLKLEAGNKTVDTDNNTYMKLVDFDSRRNEQIILNVVDSYGNTKSFTYFNPYSVIGNTSDGGSCIIK